MNAFFITILAFVAVIILSVLFFGETIEATTFIIGLVVTVIIWFILIIRKGKQIMADEESDVWDTLDSSLESQGFSITSKIEVCGTVESTKKDVKLPSLVISVDMTNKRFAFTRFVTDRLCTEFLDFENIKGGEILVGGKSTSTISTGMAGMSYGVALGLGTSDSSTIVHSMEYRFMTNDVFNPFYTISIFEREVYENAPIYRHYFEVASKLDVLVKSIVEKQSN